MLRCEFLGVALLCCAPAFATVAAAVTHCLRKPSRAEEADGSMGSCEMPLPKPE